MTPKESIRKERGETMRQIREELGFTQVKMADTLGELPSGYSRMERGLIENKRAFLQMKGLYNSIKDDDKNK
jgi:transcriptional regulator with XRE-family HTH domain